MGDAGLPVTPEWIIPGNFSFRSGVGAAERLLNLEGEVGVVAPGALADLLVVDGNPLADIRVLTTPQRSLKLIMKNGQIVKNEL